MNYFKLINLFIATFITIYNLLKIHSKKKVLQNYPKSISKQILKKHNFNIFSNYLAVILLIISIFFMSSNYIFFVLVTFVIFINISFIDCYLEEKEEHDDNEE